MFYIHQSLCISPQETFDSSNVEELTIFQDKLVAKEPKYEIPNGVLRRMGKAVRMGVGTALPFIKNELSFDGIVIGTGSGGMEDCIKFLNQIVDYEEGTLSPTNFVQSTTNAVAAQISFMNKNTGYNITHVMKGHSFENAIIDTMMLLKEKENNTYLLGSVEEISSYNYNIELLAKAFKKEETFNTELYSKDTEGTIIGEGAAMYLVNNKEENAVAKVEDIKIFYSKNNEELVSSFTIFLEKNNLKIEEIDALLLGESGDNRHLHFYDTISQQLTDYTNQLRYKHFTGEYPTSISLGLWTVLQMIESTKVPNHFIKRKGESSCLKNVLIYNNYQGKQHTLLLVKAVG